MDFGKEVKGEWSDVDVRMQVLTMRQWNKRGLAE